MSESKFVYTFLNPGLELWLKEEVKLRGLPWSPSFSKPGFMTFKVNDPRFDFEQRLDLAFARSWGAFISKQSHGRNEMIENRLWESFEVKSGEHWQGERAVRSYLQDRPMDAKDFVVSDKVVSRTYYKTAQAFELLPPQTFKSGLEIGCAPGGSVSFLLEQGLKVTGIDPAEMDQRLLEHAQFTHLQWPIQRLQAPEILGYKDIDLLSVDLNLPPDQSLDEVLRFVPHLQSLKRMLMIFKVSKPSDLSRMQGWLSRVHSAGAREAFFLHLPSHRHETLMVATY